MAETPAKVTAEYDRQIIAAAYEHSKDDASYVIVNLLREYAAKAYWAGRGDLAKEVERLARVATK